MIVNESNEEQKKVGVVGQSLVTWCHDYPTSGLASLNKSGIDVMIGFISMHGVVGASIDKASMELGRAIYTYERWNSKQESH